MWIVWSQEVVEAAKVWWKNYCKCFLTIKREFILHIIKVKCQIINFCGNLWQNSRPVCYFDVQNWNKNGVRSDVYACLDCNCWKRITVECSTADRFWYWYHFLNFWPFKYFIFFINWSIIKKMHFYAH